MDLRWDTGVGHSGWVHHPDYASGPPQQPFHDHNLIQLQLQLQQHVQQHVLHMQPPPSTPAYPSARSPFAPGSPAPHHSMQQPERQRTGAGGSYSFGRGGHFAAVQRAGLGMKAGSGAGRGGRGGATKRWTSAADGQRVWDGYQYRVIRRCPHGKIRKDLCKACGGSGICEHGNRRNGCKECGGPSICEHKRARRRCVDCGGKEICHHKQIRQICRECQKEGTGGTSLCVHAKQKQHCKECKGLRLCMHNKQLRLCKHCGESGLCRHKMERHACDECRKEDKCSHKKRRHNCTQCKEIRADPANMAIKVHEMLAFLDKEQFPGPNHPKRTAVTQLQEDLLTMALALAPAPPKPPGYPTPSRRSKTAKIPPLLPDAAAAIEMQEFPTGGGDVPQHEQQHQDLMAGDQVAAPPPLHQQPPQQQPLQQQPLQHQQKETENENAFMTRQAGTGPGEWMWLPAKNAQAALAAVAAAAAHHKEPKANPKRSRKTKNPASQSLWSPAPGAAHHPQEGSSNGQLRLGMDPDSGIFKIL